MNGWVKILETPQAWEAELWKNWLDEQYQIEAILVNKQDSAYLFGLHELFVRVEHAVFAETAIQHEKQHTNTP